jgi:hypothetical protein
MFGLAAEARRKEQNVLNCDAERELSSGKREMGVRSTGGNKKAADHAPPLFALTVFPEPFAGFQLPTCLAALNPSSMSVSRESPRHMTLLPGGGSSARAR